ncbi:MAG: lactate racemase domain-containing protein [Pirellulaceae bacterium]|jgi:hypothetical protein|nr:lactate racemase domain-containing protein [Pirellulaceae bacterium]MDP7016515.1 lactate racemase domain-containing protein [Pirellulaceae bacterium]
MSSIEYPEIFRVRQSFPTEQLADIPGEVDAQLARLDLRTSISAGQTVAITAGSRGINNIDIIVKAIADHVKSLGGEPFVVPAMGSHGGGTADGQRGILAGYGVTEDFLECPIKASMETVVVCDAAEGFPVHFDKHAFQADHVVVCGRVKPHTNFIGDIESGLMKMMLIGLGKHNGAKIYHRAIKDHSFGQIVRSVAREVLSKCHIVAGVAIVENGYDETAEIGAVPPADFESREKELLVRAKELMPKLPFDAADILLIDQIGKNISGTGMDTNIVGRKHRAHQAAEHEFPKIKNISIRGLTEATHGNATGIGLAEFCLSRAVEQMDADVTRINCLTGGHSLGAMIPLDFPSDRDVLDAALSIIGLTAPEEAKLMWIENTLHLAEVECSAVYLDEARDRDDLEILVEPRPLPLDSDGLLADLTSFAAASQ